MKALLIGATGLVGKELLRKLLLQPEFESVRILTRRPCGLKHEKLEEELVDFNRTEQWSHLLCGDVLFLCLGTTLKTAGSKAAQFKVDYSYQLQCAEAAAGNGVKSLVLVSSAGANPNSKVFYSRIKGELDEAVLRLPFRQHCILRPSLLLGKRNEKRSGEAVAQYLLPLFTRYFFKKYRPITARTVAQAMINASLNEQAKQIFSLDEIFELAQMPEMKK